MRYISLSEISSLAKSKPEGFLTEAFRLGIKRDNCLVFEDDAYESLRNFSGAIKPTVEHKDELVQEEKISPSSVNLEIEDLSANSASDNEPNKESAVYKHSTEKQARIGRGRINSI